MRLERGSAASPLSKGSDRRWPIGSKNTPVRNEGRGRRVRTNPGRTRLGESRGPHAARGRRSGAAAPRGARKTAETRSNRPSVRAKLRKQPSSRVPSTSGRGPVDDANRNLPATPTYLRLPGNGLGRAWCALRRRDATVERASTRFVVGTAGTLRQRRVHHGPRGTQQESRGPGGVCDRGAPRTRWGQGPEAARAAGSLHA